MNHNLAGNLLLEQVCTQNSGGNNGELLYIS